MPYKQPSEDEQKAQLHAALDDRHPPDLAAWREMVRNGHDMPRNTVIATGLLAGATVHEVGEAVGLGSERARQLGYGMGLVPRRIATLRGTCEAARREADTDLIREASDRLVGFGLDRISQHTGLPLDRVDELIGGRRARHEVVPSGSTSVPPASDEDLLRGLRAWAAQTTNHASTDYDRWSRREGLPGRQTVTIRWRTWRLAMEAAGLGQLFVPACRPAYASATDTELIADVVRWLRSDRPSWSSKDYSEWAPTAGAHSLALIISRLGGWSAAVEQARAVCRYAVEFPDGGIRPELDDVMAAVRAAS